MSINTTDEESRKDPLEFDEIMMRRALDLARRGAGLVSPNPMVGAVIVDPSGRIVGEGAHERFGGPHAEINAMRSARENGTDDISGATMYVTLEPCNHHGKTPPCTEAVVAAGIRRVVVAMRDPNPLVSGQGNKRLREAGIEVVVGTLEHEARALNEAYIQFIRSGLPFVTLKVAQTLDGFIALPNGESQWITGELARERGHRLRAAADGVMVGMGTARQDDPSLTVRFGVQGRNPRRIVLDRNLALPLTLKLFTDEHRDRTIVFTGDEHVGSERAGNLESEGIRVIGVPSTPRGLKLSEVFRSIGEQNMASVLVEGGAKLADSLIKEVLLHKLIFFVAPKLFGHGITPFGGLAVNRVDDAYSFTIYRTEMVGEDLMITTYLQNV